MFWSPMMSQRSRQPAVVGCGALARACLDFGQRVQASVFECQIGENELARLRGACLKRSISRRIACDCTG